MSRGRMANVHYHVSDPNPLSQPAKKAKIWLLLAAVLRTQGAAKSSSGNESVVAQVITTETKAANMAVDTSHMSCT